jgi:hypothetical protein
MEIKHDGDFLTGTAIAAAKTSGSRWIVWTRLGESRLVPSELMADATNIMEALEAFYVAGRISLKEKIVRTPLLYWGECHRFLPPKPLLHPTPPSSEHDGVSTPPK